MQKTTVVLGSLMALSLMLSPVLAQEDGMVPAVLVMTSVDGAESLQYEVTDMSIYASETTSYDNEETSVDVSLSINIATPIDAALWQWAVLKGDDRERNVTITAPGVDAEGVDVDMVYELTGARVTSFSTGYSSYSAGNLALQVSAKQLSIDGVVMN